MLFVIIFAIAALTGPANSFSTDNSNSSLPLRGGPGLVYNGNYGVPSINASSPLPVPLQFNPTQIATFAQQQIDGIIASSAFEGNCSKVLSSRYSKISVLPPWKLSSSLRSLSPTRCPRYYRTPARNINLQTIKLATCDTPRRYWR